MTYRSTMVEGLIAPGLDMSEAPAGLPDEDKKDGRSPRASRGDTSRLVPPKRRGRLCERRELLSSLVDEMLQTRVTLIVAPAGYGKTTLLSQWCTRLDEQQIPIAYYSALERDRDPPLFLAMIAGALQHAGIEIGGRPAFDEGRVREDIAIDDILLALELAGQRLVLIIDDFEHVNDPAITGLMTTLIDAAPPSVHIVIASRNFPAIPLSTLEIEGQLRLIDTYQLRLRREELAWMLDLDADMPEVREIAERTQGWPVTAELYRLWRERHRAHDTRATFGSHVAEVHNYLAEQLFSSLPPEQYALLIDIADRDEVQPDLVDAMRGRQDSARLLHEIARAMSSLMWVGRDHDDVLYRLHPLLLDHLRQALGEDVARRARLAVAASTWFLEHHRYPDAIRAALASRDEAAILHIVRALRPMHILVADGATALRQILRELPEERIARHPRLQIMATIAHFKAGFFAESRMMLDRIRQATSDFTDDPDGHPDWLTVEGNLTDLILLCQVSRYSTRIEELYDAVMAAAGDDHSIWGSGEVVMMLVRQMRGDFDAADAAILRARNVYGAVELSRYSHTQIAGHEMLIMVARGRLRRAIELIVSYQKQPDLEVPDDVSTPTLLKLILAAIRYEQEYSDGAVETLKNSLAEHSKAESWIDQYAIAYPPIATRLFVREGIGAVLDFIAEARVRAQRIGLEALPDMLDFLEIGYRARQGDVDGARRIADAVLLEACAKGTDPLAAVRGWRERDAAIQTYIRLCLAERNVEEALAAARLLVRIGQSGGRLRTTIKGLVFAAITQLAMGEADAAQADLLRAILLAYPEGFVAPFAEEGTQLGGLIDAVSNDAGIDAYARRHLDEVRRAISGAMIRTDNGQLNPREQEIIAHLAEGLSNKVIARRMGITDHTVKFHLKKIFSKLEVSSRRAAVAKVQGEGFGK